MNIKDLIESVIGEAVKQLKAQYGIQPIKTNILILPAQINDAKLKVVNLKQSLKNAKDLLDSAKDNLKSAEAMLMMEIAEEKDESGKAKFSNDAKRNAELARRCKSDPDCLQAHEALKQAQKQYDDIQFEIDKAQVDVERLQDEYTAHLKTADLVVAELTALTR